MHQFFQSILLTFTSLNKLGQKNQKTPSKRDTNFYLKLTVTTIIVGLYGQSLRKNERPHNVNSCDKCSGTAGGNGYCNHMFTLYKCLNSLNSQELECARNIYHQ